MEPYIDEILLTMLDGEEKAVRMKFKNGIAIQIDEDGDVPLFEDPIVMTYPSTYDVEENNDLSIQIETYTGRPFDSSLPECFFDIAIVFGVHHRLSQIVKREHHE